MYKLISTCGIILLALVIFCSDTYANDHLILKAKVVEAHEAKENEGLIYQNVKVEIVRGEYKGVVQEVQIPIKDELERDVEIGDRIKVESIDIDGDIYFQFYDYSRSINYIWLILLFIIIVGAFLGLRGMKTLIPSLSLLFLILTGVFPSLVNNNILILFVIIAIIAVLTSWVKLKNYLLTIIVAFSSILCLFLGYLIFSGFANVSYIEPFLGTISPISNDINQEIMNIVYLSSIFIPTGGVINASTQVAKYLMNNFEKVKKSELSEMLKKGIKISQKVSAGELNNMIIMIIGFSLVGIYILREVLSIPMFWDQGWIALQIIYIVSSGISILLITPITVFITAGIMKITKGGASIKGGQHKLDIRGKKKKRNFKYFK